MPRVVQVDSSSDLDANTRGNGDAEDDIKYDSASEDEVNKNHNQTGNEIDEDQTTFLRFPINYELYNVTYSPSEGEAYCLTCNIGGKTVKYKKDARVWLHKSRERKRKPEESENEFVTLAKNAKQENAQNRDILTVNSPDDVDKLKLVHIQQYFHNVCSTYENYRTTDIDSELSSLGDSEADLTYSEETTPSVSLSATDLYNKFNQPDRNNCVTFKDDEDDDTVSDLSETPSADLHVDQGILKYPDETDEIDVVNASGNNNRGKYYDVTRRIAPAIVMENESLNESLIDSAVNTFNTDCVAANTRFRSQHRRDMSQFNQTMPRTKSRARCETSRRSDYNFRLRKVAKGGVVKKKHEILRRSGRGNNATLPQKAASKATSVWNNTVAASEHSAKQESAPVQLNPDRADFQDTCATKSVDFQTPLMANGMSKDKCHNEPSLQKKIFNQRQSGVSKTSRQNPTATPETSHVVAAIPGPSTSERVPSLFALASMAAYKYFRSALDSYVVNDII